MRIVDTSDPEDMADAEREAKARERAWTLWGQHWDWKQDEASAFYQSVQHFRFYHCNPASELVFLQVHPGLIPAIDRLIGAAQQFNTHPWYEGWYVNLDDAASVIRFVFVTDNDEGASRADYARFLAAVDCMPANADAQFHLRVVRENFIPKPTPKWMLNLLHEQD